MKIETGEPTRIGGGPCTNCGIMLDGFACVADGVPPTAPSEGNFMLCLDCGHLMAYDHELKPRELTAAEIKEAAGDPLILLMQRARGQTKEEKP